MILSNAQSIAKTIKAIIKEATITVIAKLLNSLTDVQDTFFTSSV